MNAAALKQLKISSEDGTFRGRSSTISEDVVASMLAANKTKPAAGTAGAAKSKPGVAKPPDNAKLPPFVKYFKAPDADGGARYKVGDSQLFNGNKWYFCDAPTHRNRHKWHTHTAENCHHRKTWLAADPAPVAAAANASDDARTPDDAPPDPTAPNPSGSPAASEPQDLSVLLATCLQAAGDNPLLQALIGDALNQAEADL